MKKLIFRIIVILLIILPLEVNGKENFYFINQNGVVLSQEEYAYILKIFDYDFAQLMTKEMYSELINNELINTDVNIIENNNIMPLSSELIIENIKIKMTSTCVKDNCSITILTEWLNIPSIMSYDVMGAYLKNTSILNSPRTVVYENGNSRTITDIVIQNNGFGASFKFNNFGENKVYQYFKSEKSGIVYASYQRAIQNVSLSDSKKYTISLSGYGQVFLFDKNIREKYTNYQGVSISL